MVEIREGDFKEFFSVPRHCYGSRTAYVSPMESDLKRSLSAADNPLLSRHGRGSYFTARRAGKPVGRIVAHVHDDSNRLHRLNRSYFGFFDCADDAEAARLLLRRAEDWGRAQGCDEIAGNFNLTAMQVCGVVTEGFEEQPYICQAYNPRHIPRLLEACGYAPFFPMTTFELDLDRVSPDSMIGAKQERLLRDASLRWQKITMRDFERLMLDACRVLNDGFADNPLFVPLTDEEFMFQAKDLMWVIDERISALVYDESGPLGAIACIPDLNPLIRATGARVGVLTPWHYLRYRASRRRALLIFASIGRRFQGRGLGSLLLSRVAAALKRAGYTHLGVTWTTESNKAMVRPLEKAGARRLHHLHLYRKRLGAG